MATVNVVLLGKGDLSIRIAQWFLASSAYDLRLVVPVRPEPSWTGSLQSWADSAGVRTLPDGNIETIKAAMGEDGLDLAFSCFWDRILKAPFLEAFGRSLNLHNGPLPRYRGVSPINWALKNGELEHGVTIHEITPGVDDGPIVGQVRFSIHPDVDEVLDVYRRCLAFGWVLFEQTMPMLERITPRPQDESQALHYRRGDDHLLGDRRGFTRTETAT